VHGLAFAGILTGLGLDGAPSLLALLAFDAGVELAQLMTALLFPSLLLAGFAVVAVGCRLADPPITRGARRPAPAARPR
jgi:hypothetical protein